MSAFDPPRRTLAKAFDYSAKAFDYSPKKLNWIQCSSGGCNSLAKLDALARRHPEQVGDAPNDIALKFVHALINVNDLPHHFNDSLAAFIVENIIELAGKMVKVDRASVGCGSVMDQLNRGEIVKSKARSQNGVKLFPPSLRHFAVDGCYTSKQRRGCEPAIHVLEFL
jgi:hypothetical protein